MHNAVLDRRETVKLQASFTNQGGTFVREVTPGLKGKPNPLPEGLKQYKHDDDPMEVRSVLLSDLLVGRYGLMI